MQRSSLFGIFFNLLLLPCFALQGYATGNLDFIENKRQWNDRVHFRVNIPGGSIWLEEQGFTYLFYDGNAMDQVHDKRHPQTKEVDGTIVMMREEVMGKAHAYRMQFVNAQPTAIKGQHERRKYHNYFIGNNRSKWAGNVPLYEAVTYRNLYPNVHLNTYSKEQQFKYDLMIDPGGDVAHIKMEYSGMPQMHINGQGDLILTTAVGEVVEQQPYAYQVIEGKEQKVPCYYILEGNTVRFALPQGYNQQYPLIIDPVVVAATYSGSVETNFGHCATYDEAGNIYTAAYSLGQGYPTTEGAFDLDYNGGQSDIVVSKLNPDGSAMIYSTYIGGIGTGGPVFPDASGYDWPISIIVNQQQELYLLAYVNAPGYPVTPTAYDTTLNGGTDIAITRFNNMGSALIGSTYIGGNTHDGHNIVEENFGDHYRGEIMLDDAGNCYVVTSTRSDDFPTTAGVVQDTLTGDQDVVVFKMNANLTTLEWSTYLGSSNHDSGYGIRIDTNGDIYIAGGTGGADFPTTPGTVSPAFNGGDADGFIAHLSSDASSLLHATFWGADNMEQNFLLDIDAANNVYVFGQTKGGNMPETPGTYSLSNTRQFISKFTPALNDTIFSMMFGSPAPGSNGYDLYPSAFLVDDCENIYITGYGGLSSGGSFGTNNGIPTSVDALQTLGGFYLMVLAPNAANMIYGTYFGSDQDHVDGGTCRFDKRGAVYQGVCNCDGNFPTVAHAWETTSSSPSCDNVAFKVNLEATVTLAQADALQDISGPVCAPYAVDFLSLDNAPSHFWDFGDGSTSTQDNPSHLYSSQGDYTITYVAIDPSKCITTDTVTFILEVREPFGIQAEMFYSQGELCRDSLEVLFQFEGINTDSVAWDFGDGTGATGTTIQHEFIAPDLYTVTMTAYDLACNEQVSVTQNILHNGKENFAVIESPNVITPNSDGINDTFRIFFKDQPEVDMLSSLDEFKLTVYSRWGNKVFESSSKLWEGNTNGGEAVDAGTYFYVLEYRNGCGEEAPLQAKRGFVTVLR